tara:strand:- start:205 stop:636 length:432 start_codon:yes stop_codon:yes gene_type:complete
MEKLLAEAICIVSTAFRNKLDRGGKPYILHCLWVMDKVRHLGTEFMIVAVLHDLIEDTYWNESMLREIGFSSSTLHSVNLLTRFEGESYENYIIGICGDHMAREVKLRDLEHNSKITRLKGISKKDIERMEKYHKSYLYLKNN